MTSSRFALLIALLLANPVAWSSLTVNVTGVVVEGVCEINNGETVHVDFGSNLQARQLDGENFMKTIDYSLVCEDLTSNDLE
ncbi:fimbrial protein, partial [Escherichia coli]